MEHEIDLWDAIMIHRKFNRVYESNIAKEVKNSVDHCQHMTADWLVKRCHADKPLSVSIFKFKYLPSFATSE